MNELHLFAGIGGGVLAGQLLGHRCIGAVEFNPYRRRVLAQRQRDGALPYFPLWDDVHAFDGLPFRGRVDVVAGGFPCQAYSSAARGRNVADDLWPEMRRIVAEVAPRYVFAENVNKRAIDRAADDLEALAYTVRCVSLSAKDVGADHVRQRYWLLAHADVRGQLLGAVDAEVAGLPRVRSCFWDSDPDESRMADGYSTRVERLEATGDAQVPIVAATAWQILKEAQ